MCIRDSIGNNNHDKFLIFLIRVIFGEQIENKKSTFNMKNQYSQGIKRFRNFVENHLKAAEELTKKIQLNTSNNTNQSEIKVINNRLGHLLFPPERAIKFNSILNLSKETKKLKRSKTKKNVNLIFNKKPKNNIAVSYTHLTLPTICSV